MVGRAKKKFQKQNLAKMLADQQWLSYIGKQNNN